uniref:Uncharacterized protein n=1 Tax=Cherry green ring mottle virus TaxID=65467 RepID=A0A679G9R2_9VIRU|nr:hypothetical protein [Cherry green ring mottle virus]BCA25769.1 hypothetical protein [Cherry green ring mottle virus]
MQVLLGQHLHLVFLLLCMVCLVAGNQILLGSFWILRTFTPKLLELVNLQIFLGAVLRRLLLHFNLGSTFWTNICLDLTVRVLICFFPILIKISVSLLLLIILIAALIALALLFANFLISLGLR